MPNASGGLQVGLDVEPTVSYSIGGKSENVLKMSFGFPKGHFYLYGGTILDIIRNILKDYEKLIKTKITIPLDNGDIINFSFQPQDLPHLLGLQHLVDNPILFEYSQNRLSATDLYNRMCGMGEDAINTNEFEESVYFNELYQSRIKYFSSEMILDIIQARQIVKFDPKKVNNFSTKLDKLEYMFWKRYKDIDNNYGYFGIGFIASGKASDKNYPNTFFFRLDNEYVCNQNVVLPMSFMKKDKMGNESFIIYWDEIQKSLRSNPHYKKLKKKFLLEDGNLDVSSIRQNGNEDDLKHYNLLQLDALNKVYLPYMKSDFRWCNEEKKFVLQRMEEKNQEYYPHEIKMLLNEYKQIHKN